MTISLGSMSTGSAMHGSIKAGVWEYQKATQSFFGLTGEYIMLGRFRGRDITTWLWPSGYASLDALQTAIDTLNNDIGVSGTMTWTFGAATTTYTQCLFEGFDIEEEPWLDASGVNGWQVKGTIKFRQVKA